MALSPSVIMNTSIDIASSITHFLSDQYLNTAGISRTWRDAYGDLPTTTRGIDHDTTVDQFMTHLELGHGRGGSETPSNPKVYRPPSKILHAEKPCSIAASLGRTDLLHAAYGSGMAWKDYTACEAAARNGHLQTLKYLRFIDCPWDERTSHAAADGGNLELLQWVICNGCPSNNGTQLYAASMGDLDMVIWLHFNGHPINSSVLQAAVYAGAMYIIGWARTIGVEYTKTFTHAVQSGDMAVLKYLNDTRHVWDEDQLVDCTQYGMVDESIVRWLRVHGYLI